MGSVTCEERLFEVAAESAARERVPVDKTFRDYDPHAVFLLPPSIDDWLPEDHVARFVSDLVDDVLDLEPVLAGYTEASGAPPYDPRLMLKLLVYGYAIGVTSSREIERRCATDVAFRFLAANAAPDYRSISRFRRRHLGAITAYSGWAPPDDDTIAEWVADGVCRCPDDCLAAPDGWCEHGLASWWLILRALQEGD